MKVTAADIEAERERLRAMLPGLPGYAAKNVMTALSYLLSAKEIVKALEEQQ